MLKKLLAVTALLVLATAGSASPAQAQDYPPASNGLTISVYVAGVGVTITITAQTFEPGTPVTFTMFSDPVHLGTATADSNGVATLNATVPSSVPAGSHRIEATGIGVNGAPLTVSSGFTVAKAGSGGSGGNIPRTGSNDTVPVATAGVGVLAAGGLLVLLARRRRRAHAAA